MTLSPPWATVTRGVGHPGLEKRWPGANSVRRFRGSSFARGPGAKGASRPHRQHLKEGITQARGGVTRMAKAVIVYSATG